MPAARWDAVICHNISDLIDTAPIDAPKLLIVHDTLDGRMAQQGATFEKPQMVALLAQYLDAARRARGAGHRGKRRVMGSRR